MRKSFVRLVALAAVLILVATACKGSDAPDSSGGGSPGGGGIIEGGQLKVSGGGPDSLNPYVATAQESYAFFQIMYPFLIEYNETYDDFRPDFATDWEVSEDGKTWTFHLMDGVKWSDDQPLTSDDVKFTLDTAMLPGSGWGGTVKHMTGVEAPDPTTVVITYDQEVGNVMSQLQQVFILPKHVWEPVAKQGVKALKESPDKAPIVGAGPFTVSKYTPDQFILWEKNPNWYGEKKPHIDSWGVQFYENDEAEISALESGEVDLIWDLPPAGVDPLSAKGFVIDQSPGVEFHDIIFNSNPKKTDHAEIRDPKLRTALEYATDRERLIDTAMYGLATPGSSIVPPVTGKWFNSSLEVIPFDLEKANQTLEDAGYKDTDGDGVRETPDGTPLSYDLGTQNGQPGVNRVAEILKEDWAKAGVEVKQKPMSYNALWEYNQAPINDKTGIGEYTDFEILLWSWVPLQDPDFILSVLLCDQFSIWSDTGQCDAQYDEWYAQQGVTVDPKERKDIVWQMQDFLYETKPYIVMYYRDSVFAYSDKWDGFHPSPQGPINAFNRDTILDVHQVG